MKSVPIPAAALAALRHPDAARASELFPTAAREQMLAAILLAGAAPQRPAPPTAGRSRARAAALSACAACVLAAIVAVALPGGAAGPLLHTSPVSFRYPRRGPDAGYIVATVTDPLAAQSALDAAFRAAGLDVTVDLVPASPSAVGTVVEMSGPASGSQIEALSGGSCVTGGGGPGSCPIGVRIPRDFTGAGTITLGRAARPGERYEATNSVFAPGESLHCSGLIGATVASALPRLAAAGVRVRWQTPPPATAQPGVPTVLGSGPAPAPGAGVPVSAATSSGSASQQTTSETSTAASATGTPGAATPPPGGFHIVDGDPVSPGLVLLITQPGGLSPQALAFDQRMYGGGC